jgi:hypothetical protein
MPSDADPRKKPAPPRRRPQRPRGTPAPNPFETPRPAGEPLYFQVHFQPVPGARKGLFTALQPQLAAQLQEMIREGQLLFSGGYPTSIGGMWLLKTKDRGEAERLVLAHPAVSGHLLTWRLLELQEPVGLVVAPDSAPRPDTTEA